MKRSTYGIQSTISLQLRPFVVQYYSNVTLQLMAKCCYINVLMVLLVVHCISICRGGCRLTMVYIVVDVI